MCCTYILYVSSILYIPLLLFFFVLCRSVRTCANGANVNVRTSTTNNYTTLTWRKKVVRTHNEIFIKLRIYIDFQISKIFFRTVKIL